MRLYSKKGASLEMKIVTYSASPYKVQDDPSLKIIDSENHPANNIHSSLLSGCGTGSPGSFLESLFLVFLTRMMQRSGCISPSPQQICSSSFACVGIYGVPSLSS